MLIDSQFEEIVHRNQLIAIAVSPSAVLPIVGDTPAIAAVWTKMTMDIAEAAGYRFSRTGAREVVGFALAKGLLGHTGASLAMNGAVKFARNRIAKGIAKKAALTGAAAASIPVTAPVVFAYYVGNISFNAILALVYTRRYAEGIRSVFDAGYVTTPDVIGLVDDLVPIVGLESLGIDKEALATQLSEMLKAAPSMQEVIDAVKGLFL